ncbi:DUF3986 family protein [Fervidibacillus albus]|uniref:DUF3986 family protein n=1 Tax=Fervidibacillus albus TaxID=2980026 RepID=A0A9E8LSA3_9BACI|nr:DUF3986 family protein [Fervidibacillus albus]WAA08572.1 DUF3986 family protein [Fervidibacillus albus]
MIFDSTVHLHLGYYEGRVDLEATAYKLLNEDKWIVFLNDNQDVSLLEGVVGQGSGSFGPLLTGGSRFRFFWPASFGSLLWWVKVPVLLAHSFGSLFGKLFLRCF